MSWIVSNTEALVVQWFDDDGEITTGTATLRIWRMNGSTRQYLQSDESTWSTTPHDFSMLYVSNIGWQKLLVIPNSAKGFTMVWQASHSDSDMFPYSEEHYVTAADLDDINETALGNIELDFG